MNSELPPNEDISSVFQENVCIRGDLELTQPLLLDGKLIGNIRSQSHVIVGEKGYVEGQIEAANVTVWGRIQGNVISSSTCTLQKVSSVEGDIVSAKLAMKEGATFVGQAKIKEAGKIDPPKDLPKDPPKEAPKTINRLKEIDQFAPPEKSENSDSEVNANNEAK